MNARKRKTVEQLDAEVRAFNARFHIGDEVEYSEVVGEGTPQRYRLRTQAEVLGDHTAVVWLVGKSGCVACDHCAVPGGAAKDAALQQARTALVGLWDSKPSGGLHIDNASPACVLRVQEAIKAIDAVRSTGSPA